MKSPVQLLRSLFSDLKRLLPDAEGLDRDIITIEKRVKHEGEAFLTITLPTICDALDRGLAEGLFLCPMGFKKVPRGAIPRIFSGMLKEVFDVTTGKLIESCNPETVKGLRAATRLFKKLDLSEGIDDRLDLRAKEQFIIDDDRSSHPYTMDDRESFIYDRVCSYILPNIDTFDELEFKGKHGPGAVVEGLTPNRKWLGICQSLLTGTSDLIARGYDCFTHTLSENIVAPDKKAVNIDLSDIARLITVPKSSTSRRTITIEPVERQFAQQGFNTLLRDGISQCKVLRQCLALTDQSKNQQLALEGSRTGVCATLDLKSASDLLSLKIVEKTFASKPRLLAGLLSCRTTRLDVGKTCIEMRKYAGMGNATTFPVQSIVFACLAIAALVEGLRPSYRNVRRVASEVRVYGDDIIVPTHSVRQVVSWLHKAGLTVNLKKSFSTGNFRESCGVDAFRGLDVSPLYINTHPREISIREPSALAHYVALANRCDLRGYYAMSATIKRWVEEAFGKPLPIVPSSSGALGWHSHRDFVEFQRWNKTLQRGEVLAPMVITVKRRDMLDGYAALLKFFHTPLLGRYVGHLQKSPVRFKTRIAMRWVPV